MTPPTTYRIADKAPEFPCWLWHQGNRLMRPGWYDSRTMIRSWLPAPDHTHWCHSSERPTHDPTAPETPASSAVKGGDIPRTPTDSEIVDAAFEVAHFSKTHLWPKEGSPEFFEFATKLDRLSVAIQKRHPSFNRNIAAEMMKKA